MNLTINEVVQLNPLDIYQIYKNDFDSFYNSLYDINIPVSDYRDMVLEEIQESKQLYTGDSQYLGYILNRVNNRIKIENELNSDDNLKQYLSDLNQYKVLPNEEILELVKKAQNNDKEALNRIVKHNIRLVISIAKKYAGIGVPFEDLIQEGTLGLYSAVERFDFSKGVKFSTYATWWIKNNILKSLYCDSRNIKIPIHLERDVLKYKRTFIDLYGELRRKPTIDEIAKKMKISYKKALLLEKLQIDTVSLNQPVENGVEENAELCDFIESNENVEKTIVDNFLLSDIITAMNDCKLTEKEKYIIIHRFELFGNKKQTLSEIGKSLNVSRERIRQQEKIALNKLKISKYGQTLKLYLGDKMIDNEDYISLNNNEEKLKQLRVDLSEEDFNIFVSCNLYPVEIEIVALSLGLLTEKPKSNKEISELLKIPIYLVSQILKRSLDKLKDKKIVTKEKEKRSKKEKALPKIPIHERFGITEEQLEYVFSKLNSNERKILEMKCNNIKLSKEEASEYRNFIVIKIKDIIEKMLEEERVAEIIKQLHELIIDNTKIDFDKIEKTEEFYKLTKYFSVKETVAVLLLFGYIDDSYYSADYVKKILGMTNSEIMNIYGRANMLLKYNNETVKEKRKIIAKN